MQWQLAKTWRRVEMTSPMHQSLMQAELLQDELLGALEALGGSAGNGKLRELLGWDEPTYESVRASLVAKGRLQPGRGRGGSISLAHTSSTALPVSQPMLEQPSTQTLTAPQPTGKVNLSAFIWSVADLLRGDYKQSDYGKVILPFTVLRRLDCVLEPTKAGVLEEKAAREAQGLDPEPFLLRRAGQNFCNTSPLDMKRLMGDPDNIGENLRSYIQAFTPAVRDIFDSFEFHLQVDRLDKANLLYLVTEKFAQIDLHPEAVSNAEMGLVFEELIRKFAELSNETAGEHFTPREVIKLMVNLIFIEDDEALTQPGIVRSLYDPAAGTGGMLSVAEEHLVGMNPSARLVLSGQELNPESYAICKADMLIKGQDINSICFGNTLSDDQLPEAKYDYMLSNPPFGVEWKKIQKEIQREAELMGYSGRFGPGLPRVSDGSLLFLLHLISKMRPAQEGGSRFGIVLNGSPLFTGGAGSGESEIRRYVLENDLLEAIIALPTDMFYNTGISTYIWILSNRKPSERKGKVQLIDASSYWQKMRKSLGSKRKELSEQHINQITQLFGAFQEAEQDGKPVSKIFRNEDFGYRTITVERPVRDEAGNVVLGQRGKAKGKPQADSSLRDTENVPLSEDIQDYFEREVLPHVPDAWIDHEKTKVGYEIPFNRHFYVFTPPRPLEEIDAELKQVTDRLLEMIGGLSA
jgi:type I restriction enzyme M protein